MLLTILIRALIVLSAATSTIVAISPMHLIALRATSESISFPYSCNSLKITSAFFFVHNYVRIVNFSSLMKCGSS